MGLGAAVIGSAALGLGGSMIQAGAASSAAKEQANAANNALNLQQQMFNKANSALSPYYTAGQNALPTLQSLLTPGSSAATLSSLPGFQFQSQWGSLAAQNALTAQGLGGSSGPLAKAISDYNNGLAGTYWMNDVQGLQNFANMGSNAASALAGTAVQSGANMGNSAMAVGNAQAAGTLGQANAIAGGLGGVSNSLLLSSILGGNSGLGGGGGIYSGFPQPGGYGVMPDAASYTPAPFYE